MIPTTEILKVRCGSSSWLSFSSFYSEIIMIFIDANLIAHVSCCISLLFFSHLTLCHESVAMPKSRLSNCDLQFTVLMLWKISRIIFCSLSHSHLYWIAQFLIDFILFSLLISGEHEAVEIFFLRLQFKIAVAYQWRD